MNDDQLLTRLAESNAYPDGTALPDAIWSRDAALREIERRMRMRSQPTTQRPATERQTEPTVELRGTDGTRPRPSRSGRPRLAVALAVAGAALLVALVIGVVSLMSGDDTAPPATEPPTVVTTAAPPTTVPEAQSFPRFRADLAGGEYRVSRASTSYRITIGDGWQTTGGGLGIGSSVSDTAFTGLLGTYTVLGHGAPASIDVGGRDAMPAYPEGLVIFAYSDNGDPSVDVAVSHLRESEHISVVGESSATLGSLTYTVIDTATGEDPYPDYTATIDATPLQSVNYERALILYPDHHQRIYVTEVPWGVIIAMAYGTDIDAIATQAEEILASLVIEE